jgi:hypothetical protein
VSKEQAAFEEEMAKVRAHNDNLKVSERKSDRDNSHADGTRNLFDRDT